MPFFSMRAQPVALSVALLVLAGCSHPSADPSTFGVSAATTDAGKGAGFAWSISYPALLPQWQVLDHAIHDFAAAQKKQFLQASTAQDRVKGADYSLDLTFVVARHTADFVSVLGSGDEFTGGAHGMPLTASFNLDLSANKLVVLGDLFADPGAALKAISDECRRQLEGRNEAKMRDDGRTITDEDDKSMRTWVEKGTTPTPANFGVFLVDGLDAKAIGLAILFPPYQVGPYSDGPQQVEVPAKVFYDQLKPEYKDAFAIDTEAAKLAPGVR
ncbi:MAG: DUF3298 domain-containing protein [Proteobacteria bacterium]|nr:DUF3298 domain-containing protein [Pseudomonadota bacterium]